MPYKNVQCDVENPEDPYGTFANSFRVDQDGSEVILDFCVYSKRDNRARVVSRVRVALDFLPIIHQKIGNSLQVPSEDASTPPLYIMTPEAASS